MPKETVQAKRARAKKIVQRLKRAYPDSEISLRYENPIQLLVAVILSAQCTDARVNIVTRDLFRKYHTVDDFANAQPATFEQEIRSTGFFRAKTRNIIAMANAVRERHGGHVPTTMEELTALPGVGRKTANVVLWNQSGILEGIAVDTHVRRISALWKLTRHSDPAKIEQDLMALVPQRDWGLFTHVVIDHGRATCIARRPQCQRCIVNDLCPSALRPLDAALLPRRR